MTIRITVTYPCKEGAKFDHDYYHAKHRKLLMDRLSTYGLQRVEMDRCLTDGAGGPPPIFGAAHLIFETLAGFQQGMAAHGKEILGDIPRYTDVSPQMVISEMA
jgi:uncharacterized protein (TIGR02118 family)